jgi:hypothetical protein
MQVKCPKCGTVNKYPDECGGQQSKCGKCLAMFTLPRANPSAPSPAAQDEPSGLDATTKCCMVVGGVACLVAVGFLIWFAAIRDTWEQDNTYLLLAKLREADYLQQSDPFAAYKIYDEVLKETSQHKIEDERFSKALADAEKSRCALHLKVQDQIRAEEAEGQRQTEKEAKRAAEEAQKTAEEKRRKEAVAVYRNVPQAARNALNAVKRLEAKTEIGITYVEYVKAVGEAWGEVKIFIDSADAKRFPEYSLLLRMAIADYKSALNVWQSKFEFPNLVEKHEVERKTLQQRCWFRAGAWTVLAESLANAKEVERTLEAMQTILEKIATDRDQDFDAELDRILLNK